ncbi:MAG: hypothetical protein HPY57_12040 [Ignavibacteria bacterium]|nr:hypothetical protein [Ignavibacteria bacterium]
MKSLTFIFIFTLINNFHLFGQDGCPNQPDTWKQNITTNNVTWSFINFNIDKVLIDSVKSQLNTTKVLQAIRSAVNIWISQIGPYRKINFTELPVNSLEADIKISFEENLCSWGITSEDYKEIRLGFGRCCDPIYPNICYSLNWVYEKNISQE